MSDNNETIGFKATKRVTFLLSMIEVWMHAIMLSNNWMRLNMTLGISVIAPLIIKIDWSRIASYFAIITSRKVFIARALKFKMAVSRLATFMDGKLFRGFLGEIGKYLKRARFPSCHAEENPSCVFFRVVQYFNKLVRWVKIQTTGKCTQQYYTATRPISYLSYSCFILSAFLSRREKRNR